MRRILDLYDHPPADGRVLRQWPARSVSLCLCVDEFGPLNLQPRPGRAWRPQGQPVRLRATYTRDHGVRHMIAALDLSTGKLHYRIRDRKRWREFLDFLKTLRRRWPTEKLYLICDNFSPHKHPEVRAWCATNQVELVFLPTYASWLNWIEAEFAAVRYFALNGTDHRSHAEQDAAIGDYIRWRNQRARPKTGSRSTPRSATRITRSTLHDEALGNSRPTSTGLSSRGRIGRAIAAAELNGSSSPPLVRPLPMTSRRAGDAPAPGNVHQFDTLDPGG
ncbi:IS630 family transposase [Micromonospora phytophila]|uniref:IS630 family transposase n=1 Tax=Micromonospora phytophila TaxID=709888 RepID=UPI00202E3EE5|nr:IS630 family transposase [Micromonospora phytophila]MCM0674508.1 IS630 family transposase [Micromonospora phytophila]